MPSEREQTRSGRVLFDHPFTSTVIPWKVTAGTGALTHTTTAAESNGDGGAMKLTTSTVASEATEVHFYHARVPRRPVIVFGGRFAVMDENISNFAFYLGFRDGSSWYRSKLLHNLSANTWQYDAGESGSASLTTLLTRDTSEISSRAHWHSFNLVARFDTNRHVDTVINENEYASTVSAKALRSAADAATPNLLDFSIETTNLGGTPSAGVLIFDRLYAVAFGEDVLSDGRPYGEIAEAVISGRN